jgi:hypothetical protein
MIRGGLRVNWNCGVGPSCHSRARNRSLRPAAKHGIAVGNVQNAKMINLIQTRI